MRSDKTGFLGGPKGRGLWSYFFRILTDSTTNRFAALSIILFTNRNLHIYFDPKNRQKYLEISFVLIKIKTN